MPYGEISIIIGVSQATLCGMLNQLGCGKYHTGSVCARQGSAMSLRLTAQLGEDNVRALVVADGDLSWS